MAVSEDSLLLLHAADGEQWANFIATRLNSPQYKIKSIIRNISFSADLEQYSDARHASVSNRNIIDNTKRRSNDEFQNPAASNRDSGRSSHSTNSEFCTTLDCLNNTKAVVIFLSPDIIMSSSSFPLDITQLNPRSSVFLFLGVDIEEVRAFFGEKSQVVFKCRCCIIDVDELSVSDALVQIIEAFEDIGDSSLNGEEEDDDVYSVPGCPRQLNGIDKVFPREITEKVRDVYVLLERAAEDDVFVVLNGALPRKILLTPVCERLYQFTLPNDTASGQIKFKVECQDYCIGQASVQVLTKLDRLKAILSDTVNPLAILASALCLPSDDLDGIDTTLAFKLQQLAPAMTFDRLFPCEDALLNVVKEDRADVLYPSLLHFAADFNLRTFCSELLRYPGMLAAALTENCDGEYPNQIAARKGYTLIESDLVNFVEDQKPDSYLYVSPTPRPHVVSGRPKPHSTDKQAGYINEQKTLSTASGLYIDMADLRMSTASMQDKVSEPSDTDIISPISEISDNVFMPSFSSKEDCSNTEEANERRISQQSLETDSRSSAAMSTKAMKMLGVLEEDLSRARSFSAAGPHNRSESSVASPAEAAGNAHHSGVTHMLSDPVRARFRNNGEEPLNGQDSKLRTLTKIVSFFGKIKNKRSDSLGESSSVSCRSVKKSLSNRSDKSGKTALETRPQLTKNKSLDSASQERDSGSYSDEDKEKSWTGSIKKMTKPKEFKGRGKPLTRRLSQRAQAASKECVRDAPELPSAVIRTQPLTSLNGSS